MSNSERISCQNDPKNSFYWNKRSSWHLANSNQCHRLCLHLFGACFRIFWEWFCWHLFIWWACELSFSLPVETTCCYTQAISAKFKVNSCCYSHQAFLTSHINTALLFNMVFNAFWGCDSIKRVFCCFEGTSNL